MRYTNLQIGMIVAVMILSIVIGACVPVVAGNIDAAAQTSQTVLIEYIGSNAGGYEVNIWRVTDLQTMNVCYISANDTECLPMR